MFVIILSSQTRTKHFKYKQTRPLTAYRQLDGLIFVVTLRKRYIVLVMDETIM